MSDAVPDDRLVETAALLAKARTDAEEISALKQKLAAYGDAFAQAEKQSLASQQGCERSQHASAEALKATVTHRDECEKLRSTIAKLEQEIVTLKVRHEAQVGEVLKTHEKHLEASMKDLEEHKSERGKVMSDLSDRTNAAEHAHAECLQKINDILKDATSAGLAGAFVVQHRKLELASWVWGAILAGTCGFLVWFAFPNQAVYQSLDAFILHYAFRVPVVGIGGFVLHFCSKNYYNCVAEIKGIRHKQMVTTSFMGLRAALEEEDDQKTLVRNTLDAIAEKDTVKLDRSTLLADVSKALKDASAPICEIAKSFAEVQTSLRKNIPEDRSEGSEK